MYFFHFLLQVFPGAMVVVTPVQRKLGVQFKEKCLSAGQQQVRGRVYNLNKKRFFSMLIANGLQDALNLLTGNMLPICTTQSSPQTIVEHTGT